uniref:Uncharacterized protein n=1 Tax=Myotis myotis TaxID=51298 RepID=A0A7J7Z525_MYOMY|nr:hypothetical protein mMyoMyo1_010422 [Myotis myotis]
MNFMHQASSLYNKSLSDCCCGMTRTTRRYDAHCPLGGKRSMQELSPGGQCAPTGGVTLSQKPGSWLVSTAATTGASPDSAAAGTAGWDEHKWLSALIQAPPWPPVTWRTATSPEESQTGRGMSGTERVQVGLRDPHRPPPSPPPMHEFHALGL